MSVTYYTNEDAFDEAFEAIMDRETEKVRLKGLIEFQQSTVDHYKELLTEAEEELKEYEDQLEQLETYE